ncbi:hypothetical protein [Kocuria sp. SM24M-10]|nr:hypothetical protein [Kocuria sp. SM24M-10]KLU09422.1 hypothetical protein ABL57_12380 [Kocuria sp. SM24M-10]OLT10182.1 hypothetical protein BJF77_00120 [Kocuria sp. CNJ-770]
MSTMQTPLPHMFAASLYAAERLLAEAIHDEHVSVDAVVVLDALTEHVTAEAAPSLDAVARDAQLTPGQLDTALHDLAELGYLQELAEHAPHLSGLRAALDTAA